MKNYICPTCGAAIVLEEACTTICKTCGEQHSASALRDMKLSPDALERADADMLVDYTVKNCFTISYDIIKTVVKRIGTEKRCDRLFEKLSSMSLSKVDNMIGDVYYEKGNFSEAHKYYNISEDKDSNEHLFRYYSTRYYIHDYVTYNTYEMEALAKELRLVANRASEVYIKTECRNIIAKLEAEIASRLEYEKRRQEENSRFIPPTVNSSSSSSSTLSDDDAWHAIASGMMSTDITGM